MPARPAAAALFTVSGPMVGRSTRSSCPGLGALTKTPERPPRPALPAARNSAQRASMASVPSAASTARTWPFTTTAGLADVEATEGAHHLEGHVDIRPVFGGRCLGAEPALARQQLRSHIAGAMDTISLVLEEADDPRQQVIVASFAETEQKGSVLMAPRSNLTLARSGRFTPPIITRSPQPFLSSAANILPISPHLIQVCGKRSISSRASPRMATMCNGTPRAAANAASDAR